MHYIQQVHTTRAQLLGLALGSTVSYSYTVLACRVLGALTRDEAVLLKCWDV